MLGTGSIGCDTYKLEQSTRTCIVEIVYNISWIDFKISKGKFVTCNVAAHFDKRFRDKLDDQFKSK